MTDKQPGLAQLIEELQDEPRDGEVSAAYPEAHVLVFVTDDDYRADNAVKIDRTSCAVLLSSVETAERTVEALGLDEDSHIVLVGITLPDKVLTFLESAVSTVDEQ